VCTALPRVPPPWEEPTARLGYRASWETASVSGWTIHLFVLLTWADRFLYALFLGIDANFRLKRKDVSSEAKDPGLNHGWAFYCEVERYMKHVAANWNQKQEVFLARVGYVCALMMRIAEPLCCS
jgi:hypothetical protein